MDKEANLLNKIDSPEDLRKLKPEQLVQVSSELRQFIIDVVCNNPGHFGASLGVVELTVAIHYAFNTPYDKVIWDVGHQAYGHKILTGRRDVFSTNRKYKGISGFPKMAESEYDAFGTGHSSTSISAALGMAIAAMAKGEKRHVVAVIGDGAMTAGQAFEGLNNAGIGNTDILVILNDNNIAIDANVGALKEYLLDITTSKTYNRFKDRVWNLLGKFGRHGPGARRLAAQLEAGFKSTILDKSNLFEGFNFRYFGPIDGHDVLHLTKVLEDLKRIPGPKLLHCITTKGKGFTYAEKDQTAFHAPGKFDKKTGEIFNFADNDSILTFQEVFGRTMLELAELNEKITAITPAMPSGSSLSLMMNKLPGRVHDVGIAEQHAVTFSAGLATQGLIPYCHIYSSFIQRAYDQIIHDVALQNLHVVFCIDRGGLVGADGATHHGFFDMAYLRCVPNLVVSAPMDEKELRNMLFTSQLEKNRSPISIRYPRGRGVHKDWNKPFAEIEIGKSRLLKDGSDLAILSIGYPGNTASSVIRKLESENISVAHYDMRFVAPLDSVALHAIFRKFKYIITIEDGILRGGFGSAVVEFMADNGYSSEIRRLGIPDYFVEHGTQDELYRECGYDAEGIELAIREMVVRSEV
ncbi:MAG: 1-deoxy-D-xylulose-5-phosphate synthase [Bacteroidetes bacterium GWE2_41_25]|nr:MAG: 1-deoxy-D-xylulose-5-phosphate synthase [Bacteroidetes bacterium GWC2_40_22]OFY09385.1 MAG: 1-deoxy-D-xylulose-5-phosphate synthase [Bacteroidetes bacterium GWE2_41_25]OFY59768.1 MAG: 1-deoxy-D-xylulose-5-phosphate synthase [Bacteroidetes bacterium GWF2_41_9]HAM09352.1 1-deoxy-D-xylulose-5-phosphate synthase [Bacteroidales bacterium]HBH83365.1 1-deoxy-D-xylulose-5-phosphate synthase [Bacteroidales bacterium]